jgi:transcriptional regulator with GAF, ATPase, and Fis domain
METMEREARLGQLAVSLVDTITGDYDLDELLENLVNECKALLRIDEAGLVLADADGQLHVMAATNEAAHEMEQLQVDTGEGPCVSAYETRSVVTVHELDGADQWPALRERAAAIGFHSVHAVPLTAGDQSLGAMNLFSAHPGALNSPDAHTAKALADIASIGILHHRIHARHELVREQLQTALDSRVRIEQAKGIVSSRRAESVDAAFTRIRSFARNRGLRLQDVATQIIDESLEV